MHFQQQSKHFSRLGRNFTLPAVLFCVFALLASGCDSPKSGESLTGDPAASVRAAPGDEKPEQGGRITMATLGEPSNLISVLSTDSASHEVASLIYVSPLRYDKNIVIEP